jgi:hypothetical protein
VGYLEGQPFTYSQERAHPLVEGGGEYRPHIGGVDIIAHVQQYGYGPHGPRDLAAGPPYDLFDGPLPGQTFEDWKRAIQGEYYKPPEGA